MKGRLTGKVAVITGMETAIASDLARRFASEGAAIVVNGACVKTAQQIVDSLQHQGAAAIAYAGNLSQASHALNCIHTAINRYGQIDVLVTSAETSIAASPAEDYPLDELYQLQQTIRSTFLMTKYALPYLRKTQGTVITIGAEAGFSGHLPGNLQGTAMKAWLRAFTQRITAEQSAYGIRAHCFWSEGSELQPKDTAYDRPASQAVDVWSDTQITSQEVPDVCVFLASHQGSSVSGALYPFYQDAVLTLKQVKVASRSKVVQPQLLSLQQSWDALL
jgi:NAD(P)-dependent dehydrogenase (short-subunit alcohol dehydrogenase family)